MRHHGASIPLKWRQSYLLQPLGRDTYSFQLTEPVWYGISLRRPCAQAVMPSWMLGYSVVSDSFQPYRLQPTRLLCPWNFPGKNTGVGCHFLLQGSRAGGHTNVCAPRRGTRKDCLTILSTTGAIPSAQNCLRGQACRWGVAGMGQFFFWAEGQFLRIHHP